MTVLLSTSLARPAWTCCNWAELFLQPGYNFFAQPCTRCKSLNHGKTCDILSVTCKTDCNCNCGSVINFRDVNHVILSWMDGDEEDFAIIPPFCCHISGKHSRFIPIVHKMWNLIQTSQNFSKSCFKVTNRMGKYT